jgi:hypothetical protein
MRLNCLLLAGLLPLAAACDSKDWEAAGYQDGYAATINTACGFRASMIHGKFDDADYAKGYSRGSQAGASAMAQQGCEKLK